MPDIKGVQIFAVGTWNGFKFVEEDLDEIVMNTNTLLLKGTNKPPLKLGHSTNQILKGQSDGDPALGRVVNYRVENKKILADFVNVPDIILRAIEKELWTSVSIEAEVEHVKNFGWFVKAVALLGADIPAVKVIDDLQAFLSDADLQSPIISNIQLGFSEPLIIFNDEVVMPDNKNKDDASTKDPTVIVNIPADNKELEKKFADSQTELAVEKEANKKKDEELKAFKEKETERKFADQKVSILQPYKEDSKAGKLMPAIVDKIEVYLDSQKASFSENPSLSLSPELTREIATAYSEKLDQSEGANSDGTGDSSIEPDEELELAIATVRANAKMTYAEAEEAVFNSQPALWAKYAKWTQEVSLSRGGDE